MKRSDTTIEMQQEYDRRWRALSPEERFTKGLALIHASRQMLIAGIRAQRPELTGEELKRVLLETLYLGKIS